MHITFMYSAWAGPLALVGFARWSVWQLQVISLLEGCSSPAAWSCGERCCRRSSRPRSSGA